MRRCKRASIDYKIRLAFREDKELLYPTWISVPAFADRIDVLDVEIRIRRKKTASLFSTTSSIVSQSDEGRRDGDLYFASLVLLQRFLERGPSFLSKRIAPQTHTSLTIGTIVLHVVPKDLFYPQPAKDVFSDTIEWVNEFLVDEEEGHVNAHNLERWKRTQDFLRIFTERIDRLAVQVEDLRQEWDLKRVMAEREERFRRRREEADRAEGSV